MLNIVNKLVKIIAKNKNQNIILLRQKEIIQWIFNDLTFLPIIDDELCMTKRKKILKKNEFEWGKKMLLLKNKNIKVNKQWTNKFGEYICEEIYTLLDKNVYIPKKINHFQPDLETDNEIIEVKTGTYGTEGTAHEKILGVPFKYADIPELYKKPLKIFLIGESERKGRDLYGILNSNKRTDKKNKYINFFKENGIEYIASTDLLKSLI
mgnify:CR=1 FL=1|jgi:hypothetical protein